MSLDRFRLVLLEAACSGTGGCLWKAQCLATYTSGRLLFFKIARRFLIAAIHLEDHLRA